MPTFRKKPMEIVARQVPNITEDVDQEGVFKDLADWCGGETVTDAVDGPCILIHTLEGSMKARPDDWIIKDVDNNFYPYDPAIFAMAYEAVR